MNNNSLLEKLAKYPAREVMDTLEVEELDAIQEMLDSFAGLLHIDGSDVSGWLGAVYCIARTNACDRSIMAYLAALEDKQAARELAEGVLLDLATEQKRKTLFQQRIKTALKPRAALDYTPPAEMISESAVEDILAEMNISVRFNLITKKAEVHGGGTKILFEKYSRDNITSILPTLIYDIAKSRGIKTGTGGAAIIKAYLFNLADANRYNPIREMLIENENDDSGHLEMIYQIMGISLSFDKLLVRKWLIQTVAYAFADLDNPVSCEGVLVLQGKQGICKTSFFRTLAGDPLWFTEGAVIDMRNKDTLLTAISGWICELGEIDSTFRKDQSALKGFITRTIDRIRLPYAPADSDMPRTTSLCGTVNPEQFLKDSTGNRRYWTIHVENIDRKRLFALTKQDVFRLWGYVYHLYKQDAQGFRLTEKETAHLNARNHDYSVTLPFEDEIRQFLDFTRPVRDWTWHSPAEIAAYFPHVNAIQVGMVFSKIEDEESDVVKRRGKTSSQYLLPMDLSKLQWKTSEFHVG